MARKKSKSRRGRGEGTIAQRSDGRWVASVSCGVVGGKRIRKWVSGATKREVQEKLQRFAYLGGYSEPLKMKLADYLSYWLNSIQVADSTWQGYEREIRLHIVPAIGSVVVGKLARVHVDAMMAEAERKGLGANIRCRLRTRLTQALKPLIGPAGLHFNPCDNVTRPRLESREIHPLTASEAERFLKAAAPSELNALYVLALLSGARQGELLSLEWRDVDFDNKLVSIQRTLTDGRGGLKVKEPKTKSSRRRIEIPERAILALNQHRQLVMRNGHAAEPRVFYNPATPHGYIRRTSLLRDSLYPLLEDAGLPRIRFHDLRHTHASLLLLAGENPKIVQERLGHRDIQTTLGLYSHILPTIQRQAVDKLDAMFG